MITDIIFDFFGTLVEYSESRDTGHHISAYDYLKSQDFDLELKDFNII